MSAPHPKEMVEAALVKVGPGGILTYSQIALLDSARTDRHQTGTDIAARILAETLAHKERRIAELVAKWNAEAKNTCGDNQTTAALEGCAFELEELND